MPIFTFISVSIIDYFSFRDFLRFSLLSIYVNISWYFLRFHYWLIFFSDISLFSLPLFTLFSSHDITLLLPLLILLMMTLATYYDCCHYCYAWFSLITLHYYCHFHAIIFIFHLFYWQLFFITLSLAITLLFYWLTFFSISFRHYHYWLFLLSLFDYFITRYILMPLITLAFRHYYHLIFSLLSAAFITLCHYCHAID